jgi:hypothetical protein
MIGGGAVLGGDRPDRARFTRYEPLRHAGELMLGMVSGLERKNCWVRHEVLSDRVEVKDRYRWVVAAAW